MAYWIKVLQDLFQRRLRLVIGIIAGIGFLAAGAVGIAINNHIQVQRELAAEQEKQREIAQEATEEAARLAQIEAAWQARLQRARDLSTTVSFNSDDIQCDLKYANAPTRSSGSAGADLLMTVAEQPLVVFFVHGFEYQTSDGRQSFDYVRALFADEARIAKSEVGGSALCYVRWSSLNGFGDDQLQLVNAIEAVRKLSRDPLLITVAPRRIVILGYSAGGNFAEYAIVHALAQEALETVPENAPSAELRLVTMGTPHGGADLANLTTLAVKAVSVIAKIVGWLNDDDKLQQDSSSVYHGMDELEHDRGYQQLEPNNPDVISLNADFAKVVPQMEYLNVFSGDDEFVPTDSARFGVGMQALLSGIHHTDFPKVVSDSPWERLQFLLYGPVALTQANVDQTLLNGTNSPNTFTAPQNSDTRIMQ